MGDHLQHLIIKDSKKWLKRSSLRDICNHLTFVSQIETKNVQEAFVDDY